MMCLLTGHKVVIDQGRGKYEGRTAVYCSVCGKIMENYSTAPEQQKTRGYESAAKEFFNER